MKQRIHLSSPPPPLCPRPACRSQQQSALPLLAAPSPGLRQETPVQQQLPDDSSLLGIGEERGYGSMWSSCLASGLGTVTAELPLCSCARPPHRRPAASPGTQLPSWPGAQRGCSRPPQALLCWASVLAPPAHSHPTPWPWVSGTRDGHSGPGLHPSSLPQALWPRGQRVGSSVPLSAPALQGDCETSQASTCTSPPPTLLSPYGWLGLHLAQTASGHFSRRAVSQACPGSPPSRTHTSRGRGW